MRRTPDLDIIEDPVPLVDMPLAIRLPHSPKRVFLAPNERGLTFDAELWSWYESAQPRGGAVVLLDEDGNESMRWNFSGALAVGWEGPPLDARNPEIALEKLEIAYEGLECKRT